MSEKIQDCTVTPCSEFSSEIFVTPKTESNAAKETASLLFYLHKHRNDIVWEHRSRSGLDPRNPSDPLQRDCGYKHIISDVIGAGVSVCVRFDKVKRVLVHYYFLNADPRDANANSHRFYVLAEKPMLPAWCPTPVPAASNEPLTDEQKCVLHVFSRWYDLSCRGCSSDRGSPDSKERDMILFQFAFMLVGVQPFQEIHSQTGAGSGPYKRLKQLPNVKPETKVQVSSSNLNDFLRGILKICNSEDCLVCTHDVQLKQQECFENFKKNLEFKVEGTGSTPIISAFKIKRTGIAQNISYQLTLTTPTIEDEPVIVASLSSAHATFSFLSGRSCFWDYSLRGCTADSSGDGVAAVSSRRGDGRMESRSSSSSFLNVYPLRGLRSGWTQSSAEVVDRGTLAVGTGNGQGHVELLKLIRGVNPSLDRDAVLQSCVNEEDPASYAAFLSLPLPVTFIISKIRSKSIFVRTPIARDVSRYDHADDPIARQTKELQVRTVRNSIQYAFYQDFSDVLRVRDDAYHRSGSSCYLNSSMLVEGGNSTPGTPETPETPTGCFVLVHEGDGKQGELRSPVKVVWGEASFVSVKYEMYEPSDKISSTSEYYNQINTQRSDYMQQISQGNSLATSATSFLEAWTEWNVSRKVQHRTYALAKFQKFKKDAETQSSNISPWMWALPFVTVLPCDVAKGFVAIHTVLQSIPTPIKIGKVLELAAALPTIEVVDADSLLSMLMTALPQIHDHPDYRQSYQGKLISFVKANRVPPHNDIALRGLLLRLCNKCDVQLDVASSSLRSQYALPLPADDAIAYDAGAQRSAPADVPMVQAAPPRNTEEAQKTKHAKALFDSDVVMKALFYRAPCFKAERTQTEVHDQRQVTNAMNLVFNIISKLVAAPSSLIAFSDFLIQPRFKPVRDDGTGLGSLGESLVKHLFHAQFVHETIFARYSMSTTSTTSHDRGRVVTFAEEHCYVSRHGMRAHSCANFDLTSIYRERVQPVLLDFRGEEISLNEVECTTQPFRGTGTTQDSQSGAHSLTLTVTRVDGFSIQRSMSVVPSPTFEFGYCETDELERVHEAVPIQIQPNSQTVPDSINSSFTLNVPIGKHVVCTYAQGGQYYLTRLYPVDDRHSSERSDRLGPVTATSGSDPIKISVETFCTCACGTVNKINYSAYDDVKFRISLYSAGQSPPPNVVFKNSFLRYEAAYLKHLYDGKDRLCVRPPVDEEGFVPGRKDLYVSTFELNAARFKNGLSETFIGDANTGLAREGIVLSDSEATAGVNASGVLDASVGNDSTAHSRFPWAGRIGQEQLLEEVSFQLKTRAWRDKETDREQTEEEITEEEIVAWRDHTTTAYFQKLRETRTQIQWPRVVMRPVRALNVDGMTFTLQSTTGPCYAFWHDDLESVLNIGSNRKGEGSEAEKAAQRTASAFKVNPSLQTLRSHLTAVYEARQDYTETGDSSRSPALMKVYGDLSKSPRVLANMAAVQGAYEALRSSEDPDALKLKCSPSVAGNPLRRHWYQTLVAKVCSNPFTEEGVQFVGMTGCGKTNIILDAIVASLTHGRKPVLVLVYDLFSNSLFSPSEIPDNLGTLLDAVIKLGEFPYGPLPGRGTWPLTPSSSGFLEFVDSSNTKDGSVLSLVSTEMIRRTLSVNFPCCKRPDRSYDFQRVWASFPAAPPLSGSENAWRHPSQRITELSEVFCKVVQRGVPPVGDTVDVYVCHSCPGFILLRRTGQVPHSPFLLYRLDLTDCTQPIEFVFRNGEADRKQFMTPGVEFAMNEYLQKTFGINDSITFQNGNNEKITVNHTYKLTNYQLVASTIAEPPSPLTRLIVMEDKNAPNPFCSNPYRIHPVYSKRKKSIKLAPEYILTAASTFPTGPIQPVTGVVEKDDLAKYTFTPQDDELSNDAASLIHSDSAKVNDCNRAGGGEQDIFSDCWNLEGCCVFSSHDIKNNRLTAEQDEMRSFAKFSWHEREGVPHEAVGTNADSLPPKFNRFRSWDETKTAMNTESTREGVNMIREAERFVLREFLCHGEPLWQALQLHAANLGGEGADSFTLSYPISFLNQMLYKLALMDKTGHFTADPHRAECMVKALKDFVFANMSTSAMFPVRGSVYRELSTEDARRASLYVQSEYVPKNDSDPNSDPPPVLSLCGETFVSTGEETVVKSKKTLRLKSQQSGCYYAVDHYPEETEPSNLCYDFPENMSLMDVYNSQRRYLQKRATENYEGGKGSSSFPLFPPTDTRLQNDAGVVAEDKSSVTSFSTPNVPFPYNNAHKTITTYPAKDVAKEVVNEGFCVTALTLVVDESHEMANETFQIALAKATANDQALSTIAKGLKDFVIDPDELAAKLDRVFYGSCFGARSNVPQQEGSPQDEIEECVKVKALFSQERVNVKSVWKALNAIGGGDTPKEQTGSIKEQVHKALGNICQNVLTINPSPTADELTKHLAKTPAYFGSVANKNDPSVEYFLDQLFGCVKRLRCLDTDGASAGGGAPVSPPLNIPGITDEQANAARLAARRGLTHILDGNELEADKAAERFRRLSRSETAFFTELFTDLVGDEDNGTYDKDLEDNLEKAFASTDNPTPLEMKQFGLGLDSRIECIKKWLESPTDAAASGVPEEGREARAGWMILNASYLTGSIPIATEEHTDIISRTVARLTASKGEGDEDEFTKRMLFLPAAEVELKQSPKTPMLLITLPPDIATLCGEAKCLLLWTCSLSVLDVYRCNVFFRTAMQNCIQFCTTNWLQLQTAGNKKDSIADRTQEPPTMDITTHMKRDLSVKIQVSKGKKLFVTATPDPGCVSNMMPVYEENGVVFDHDGKVVKRTEAILGFYDNEALIYPSAHALHWCMLYKDPDQPRLLGGVSVKLVVTLHRGTEAFARLPSSGHVLQELWRSNWLAFEFKWKFVNTFSCPYLGNGWARYAELLNFMRSQFAEGRWYPMVALFDFHRDALEFCLAQHHVFKLEFRATVPQQPLQPLQPPQPPLLGHAIFPGNDGVIFVATPALSSQIAIRDHDQEPVRLDWFGGANINTDVSLPISFIDPRGEEERRETVGEEEAEDEEDEESGDDALTDTSHLDSGNTPQTRNPRRGSFNFPYKILREIQGETKEIKKETSIVLVQSASSTAATTSFGVRGRLPWPRVTDYSVIGSRRILQASDNVCALHALCENTDCGSSASFRGGSDTFKYGAAKRRDISSSGHTGPDAKSRKTHHSFVSRENGNRDCDIDCLVAAYEDFLGKPCYKYKANGTGNFAVDYANLDTSLLSDQGFLHAEHHVNGADKRLLVRMGTSIHEVDLEQLISEQDLQKANSSVQKDPPDLSPNACPRRKAQRVVDICCTHAVGVREDHPTCLPRGAAGRGRSLVFVDTDIKDRFVQHLKAAAKNAQLSRNVRIRVVVLDNDAPPGASCDSLYATKNQYQADTLYDGSSRMIHNDKQWHDLLKRTISTWNDGVKPSLPGTPLPAPLLTVEQIRAACFMSQRQAERVVACLNEERERSRGALRFESLMQKLAALGIDKTYEPCVCLFVAEVGPNASPNWGQGLDMLMTTGMFVVDPCTSLTLYRQMIGRATRVCAFNRQSDYSYTGCDATAFYVVLLATRDESDKKRIKRPSSDYLNITNLLNEARADTLPTLLTASFNNVKAIDAKAAQDASASSSQPAAFYVKNLMKELPTSMRWETRSFPRPGETRDDEKDENVSRVTDRLFIGATPTGGRDYTLVPIRNRQDLRNCLLLYCRWHKVSGPSDPKDDNVLRDIVRFKEQAGGGPLMFESSSIFTYKKDRRGDASQRVVLTCLTSDNHRPKTKFMTAEDEILNTELEYALNHYATCEGGEPDTAARVSDSIDVYLPPVQFMRALQSGDDQGLQVRHLKLSDCQSLQFDETTDDSKTDELVDLLRKSIDLGFVVGVRAVTDGNPVVVQESLLHDYKTYVTYSDRDQTTAEVNHVVLLKVGDVARTKVVNILWERRYIIGVQTTGDHLTAEESFFVEGSNEYVGRMTLIQALRPPSRMRRNTTRENNYNQYNHYLAGVDFEQAFLPPTAPEMHLRRYELAKHNPYARAWFLCDVEDKFACAQSGYSYNHVDVISPLQDAVDYASVSTIHVKCNQEDQEYQEIRTAIGIPSQVEGIKVHKTHNDETAFLRVAIASQMQSSWQSITLMPHLWALPGASEEVKREDDAEMMVQAQPGASGSDDVVVRSMVTDLSSLYEGYNRTPSFEQYNKTFQILFGHFETTQEASLSLGDPFCPSSLAVESLRNFVTVGVQTRTLYTGPQKHETYSAANDPFRVMKALAIAIDALAKSRKYVPSVMYGVVNDFYEAIGDDEDATRLSLQLLVKNLRLLTGDVCGFGAFDPGVNAQVKRVTRDAKADSVDPVGNVACTLYWDFYSAFETKTWEGNAAFQNSSKFPEKATLLVKFNDGDERVVVPLKVGPTDEAIPFTLSYQSSLQEYQVNISRTNECLFHLCMVFRHVKNISSNRFRLLKEVNAGHGQTRKVVLGNFVYAHTNTYRLTLTPSVDIEEADAEKYQRSGSVELFLETTPKRWVIGFPQSGSVVSRDQYVQSVSASAAPGCTPFGAYTIQHRTRSTAQSATLHVEWFKDDPLDTSTDQCVQNFVEKWKGVPFEKIVSLLTTQCLQFQTESRADGATQPLCFSTAIATALVLNALVRYSNGSDGLVQGETDIQRSVAAALARPDLQDLKVAQILRDVNAWKNSGKIGDATRTQYDGTTPEEDVKDRYKYLRQYVTEVFAWRRNAFREPKTDPLFAVNTELESFLVSYVHFPWTSKIYQIGATSEDNFFQFLQMVMDAGIQSRSGDSKFLEYLELMRQPPQVATPAAPAAPAAPGVAPEQPAEPWVWQAESLKLLYEYEANSDAHDVVRLDVLTLSKVRSYAQGGDAVVKDPNMIQKLSRPAAEDGRTWLEDFPVRDGLHVAYLSCSSDTSNTQRECMGVLAYVSELEQVETLSKDDIDANIKQGITDLFNEGSLQDERNRLGDSEDLKTTSVEAIADHYVQEYWGMKRTATPIDSFFEHKSYTVTYYKCCNKSDAIGTIGTIGQPTLSANITILRNDEKQNVMRVSIKDGHGTELIAAEADVNCEADGGDAYTHLNSGFFNLTQIVVMCGWYEVASVIDHTKVKQCTPNLYRLRFPGISRT